MRRSLAYAVVNFPWRLVTHIRAARLGKARRRLRDEEHVAWAKDIGDETRRERRRQLFAAVMHGADYLQLTQWQRDMLNKIVLDSFQEDLRVYIGAPRQHGGSNHLRSR